MTLRVAQEGLSSSGNEQLDRIRDLWGERLEDDALAGLEKFKAAPTWPLLNAEVRAKALRIEAGLRLQKGDKTNARKLFNEAKEIAPEANARVLEARLIQDAQGAEAALAFLNQPTTDDERVFRWNLLLAIFRLCWHSHNLLSPMLRWPIKPSRLRFGQNRSMFHHVMCQR